MSSYDSNVSVYAEMETGSLVLVLDGQEFVIDRENVADFIGAIFDVGLAVGVVENINKKGLH